MLKVLNLLGPLVMERQKGGDDNGMYLPTWEVREKAMQGLLELYQSEL